MIFLPIGKHPPVLQLSYNDGGVGVLFEQCPDVRFGELFDEALPGTLTRQASGNPSNSPEW